MIFSSLLEGNNFFSHVLKRIFLLATRKSTQDYVGCYLWHSLSCQDKESHRYHILFGSSQICKIPVSNIQDLTLKQGVEYVLGSLNWILYNKQVYFAIQIYSELCIDLRYYGWNALRHFVTIISSTKMKEIYQKISANIFYSQVIKMKIDLTCP